MSKFIQVHLIDAANTSKGKLLQVICAFIEPHKSESYWINKLNA